MHTEVPRYLYKVVSYDDWQESQQLQNLKDGPLDKNFIHLATESQLPHIIEKFWKNKEHLVLKLDTSQLIGRLVHEKNPGGTTPYYHLYEGKIPIEAVMEAKEQN